MEKYYSDQIVLLDELFIHSVGFQNCFCFALRAPSRIEIYPGKTRDACQSAELTGRRPPAPHARTSHRKDNDLCAKNGSNVERVDSSENGAQKGYCRNEVLGAPREFPNCDQIEV